MPSRGSGPRHADEVQQSDRRWLLLAIAVFGFWLAGMLGAYALYRATGPHPQVRTAIKRLKGLARRFLPRWTRPKPDP